jgi:CheY-like chemotaxis protein
MADTLALVADANSTQRQLITRTLERAGYVVHVSSTPLQLNVELHSTPAFITQGLLLVMDPSFTAECGRALNTLLRGRNSAGIPSPCVVLTRTPVEAEDVGDLGLRDSPHVLALPLDPQELEAIARRHRLVNGSLQRPH